jgi:SSS family solute:Na+ symporter
MVYQWIVAPNWLHYCLFLFFLSIAVVWVVSQFTPDPERARIEGLTYGSASPAQIAETRASWNQWDVIHSLIIVGVIVVFYIYFW